MRWIFLVLAVCQAIAGEVRVSASSADIQDLARSLSFGESLVLTDVLLSEQRGPQELELKRFRVFSPHARVILNTDSGPIALPTPKNVYLKGSLLGSNPSSVFLSILEDGTIRGLANQGQKYWVFAGGQRVGGPSSGLVVREILPQEAADLGRPYECKVDQLKPSGKESSNVTAHPAPGPIDGTLTTYAAEIAVETDQEYLAKFSGDTTEATNYAGDLIGYSSTVYSAEVDTALVVGDLFLWSTTDPWTETDVGCRLYQFGRYWNDNRSGVSRTTAHFLSGRSTNAGIAWVGVLCRGAFNVDLTGAGCGLSPTTDNYGGAYGYSSGLDANFNINTPSVLWDIVVVAHEMGHNFNSPHTHCYAGVGGNPDPVDACYNGQSGTAGCYSGTESLPGVGSLTGGTPGSGNGTIMSYCHLLSGLLGNITFTFGTGHIYGIAPVRVPQRMNAHVVSQDAGNPGCFVDACVSPAITGDPSSTSRCTGLSVTFTVTATGTDLTYQWRKDGADIGGAVLASLELQDLTVGDAADYDCVVTNVCGTATSGSATLTIVETIEVTGQPASESLCVGDSTTLSVTVSGSSPSYQWQKDTVDIPGATSASLSLNMVQASDSGSYRCQVTNSCGTVNSSSATISVTTPITIDQEPQNQTICDGLPASFSVLVSGDNPSYQWRKNGADIPGAVASELSFGAVSPSDAGNYDCVVGNSCGNETSASASLTVLNPVSVTNHPDAAELCVGDAALLSVTASGSGSLSYQWRKDGQDIPSATSSTLSINPAAIGDSGLYDCRVTNSCGSQLSSSAQIDVVDLVIIQDPADSYFCAGDNGQLSVLASGLGVLEFQWRKNGVDLGGEVSSSLILNSVGPSDAGDYDCVITDDCTSVTSEIAQVTIGTEPLVVGQTIFVQGIGAVTLSAAICDGATWDWKNLTTNQVFGMDENPLVLPYLDETTGFELRVETSTTHLAQFLVLVSENHVYANTNGDGCNTIEDLWWVCPDWRNLQADPNGNGIIEILDFLYINMDYPAPCDP